MIEVYHFGHIMAIIEITPPEMFFPQIIIGMSTIIEALMETSLGKWEIFRGDPGCKILVPVDLVIIGPTIIAITGIITVTGITWIEIPDP